MFSMSTLDTRFKARRWVCLRLEAFHSPSSTVSTSLVLALALLTLRASNWRTDYHAWGRVLHLLTVASEADSSLLMSGLGWHCCMRAIMA